MRISSPLSLTALLGALVSLASCLGPAAYELDENSDCALPGTPDEDPALQVDAPTLVVGESAEQSGEFTGWSDGDQVDAHLGFQGLLMLTPTVRLVGQGDRSERCLFVSVTATGPDPTVAENAYEFTEDAGDLIAGPIYVPLEGDRYDDEFQLHVVVTGELYQSVQDLTVRVKGEL